MELLFFIDILYSSNKGMQTRIVSTNSGDPKRAGGNLLNFAAFIGIVSYNLQNHKRCAVF